MANKEKEALEANMGSWLLHTTNNGDTVKGIGTKEKPFTISVPKDFSKENMEFLMKNMANVILESTKENGAFVVSFETIK